MQAHPAKSWFSESSRLEGCCNAAFCPNRFDTVYDMWPVGAAVASVSIDTQFWHFKSSHVCCSYIITAISLPFHPSAQTRYIGKPSALCHLNHARKCNCMSSPDTSEKDSPCPDAIFLDKLSEMRAVSCCRGGREIYGFSLELGLTTSFSSHLSSLLSPLQKSKMLALGCSFVAIL